MKIYVTRHGETRLNKHKLMQGLTDEPLNETGIAQAEKAAKSVEGVKFDAVFSSPLNRAKTTASIISGWNPDDIITDERIIEVNFGKYELKPYGRLGLKMTLFWLRPQYFKNPKTVESLNSIVTRSHAFLKDLEKENYETVLVVCHGGIIRGLCGYLENRKYGIRWRPKPLNCEIRVYEGGNGKYELTEDIIQE